MQTQQEKKWFSIALALAAFTIAYNLAEGIVSVYLGYEDGALTLFGFGLDSFIETISGFGVAHMVFRIFRSQGSGRDKFERTALKVTGACFYALAAGLALTAAMNAAAGKKPETTVWGAVVALVSILIMWALLAAKLRCGKKLDCQPIIADAHCTKVCIYMSAALLLASALYEWTHLPYIDSAGALALAYFSFREGRECFHKLRSGSIHCSDCR